MVHLKNLTKITSYPQILVSSNILSYEKPDYVYIPIEQKAHVLVKIGTKVSIGSPLMKGKSVITSPVSGKVTAMREVATKEGNLKAIEILNDYQEAKIIDPILKNNYNNIKKDKLASLLKTYFNVDFADKENIVLNCLDDEPYIVTESFYLYLYYEGFLELIDKLASLFNIKTITISLKSTNSENISKLMECLGMYPNIKLQILPDLYLLGHNSILAHHLNLDYSSSLFIKASSFYNIYNLIFRNRQISDKLITISGNGVINPSVIRVKIGTKLIDVISSLLKLKKTKLIYVAEGLMSGTIINPENFVITANLSGIIITKESKTNSEQPCLNCGACLNICPVGLNPLLLKNKEYFEKVKSKCLKCGLCTYICPSYINFNQIIEGESHE